MMIIHNERYNIPQYGVIVQLLPILTPLQFVDKILIASTLFLRSEFVSQKAFPNLCLARRLDKNEKLL